MTDAAAPAPRPGPTQDRLSVAGRAVGVLTWTGGDFPWAHGTFTPGPDLAFLTPFLITRADGRAHLDLDALDAAGHAPSTVLLDQDTFLHALELSPDGAAAWRIGVDPLDLT
jgi:hypothetical protein